MLYWLRFEVLLGQNRVVPEESSPKVPILLKKPRYLA